MLKRLLSGVGQGLQWLESALLVVLLSGLIGLAAYQVIARNFFDTGLLFGDALVRVLVLWVTMVGAMVAARRDEHIRIDVLLRLLPVHLHLAVRRLTFLFTAGVCGLLAYYSAVFVSYEIEDGSIAFASMPAWACELIIPVAAAVLSLRYLVFAVRPL